LDKAKASGSIKRERLHDQVTRNIAVRILQHSPEDLSAVLTTETDLCKYLDVSRSILRESIKVLAAKGMLEVRPGTGIRVHPREDWNLLDSDLLRWQCEVGVDRKFIENLFQVRLLLEPPTAEAAAARASVDEVRLICRLCEEMEKNISDFDTYVNADIEFHHAISYATHNDLLIHINETIFGALRGSQDIFKTQRDGAGRALPLHREVAEAIEQRKPETARAAMHRLVQQAQDDILVMIERRSTGNPAGEKQIDGDGERPILREL
jgi:GntR family galactonate operon transcriptional repressor